MAKIKKELKCVFTTEEKLQIGNDLATAQQKQTNLKQQMKESAAQYKAGIEAEQTQIDNLAQKIRLGYEYRSIECEIKYHTPAEGKKTVVRLDTGELESVAPMTSDELQDLFINNIGKKEDEHVFIFRNKSRCQLATPEEFKLLTQKGKFAKVADGYTEKRLVDYKPNKIELTLVVSYPGDAFEVWEFEKPAAAKAETSKTDAGKDAKK